MPRAKDRVRSEDVTLDEDLTFADLQLPVRAASSHDRPRAPASLPPPPLLEIHP